MQCGKGIFPQLYPQKKKYKEKYITESYQNLLFEEEIFFRDLDIFETWFWNTLGAFKFFHLYEIHNVRFWHQTMVVMHLMVVTFISWT